MNWPETVAIIGVAAAAAYGLPRLLRALLGGGGL
jgi:hypothetical protein